MGRNEIILELYKSEFVPKYVHVVAHPTDADNMDDIIAEIWLMICKIDDSRLLAIYNDGGMGQIYRYVSGMIWNQLRSTSSAYYKRYKVPQRRMVYGLTAATLDAFGTVDRPVTMWERTSTATPDRRATMSAPLAD